MTDSETIAILRQQVATLRAALERVSKDLRLVRNHDCTVQDISEETEDAINAALAQTEPKVTT